MKKIKISENAFRKIVQEEIDDFDYIYDNLGDDYNSFKNQITPVVESLGFYVDECNSCVATVSKNDITVRIELDDDTEKPYVASFNGSFFSPSDVKIEDINSILELVNALQNL